MKYEAIKMGAKRAGTCVKCGKYTGSRRWELDQTVLIKDQDGKWAVCHAECCPAAAKRMRGFVLGGTTTFELP